MGHIQRRAKDKWRARYIGPDGRERSKTFARKTDAERYLATVEASKVRGDWVDPRLGRTTFAHWAKRWFGTISALKPKTRAGYESLLRTVILPTFDGVQLAQIQPVESPSLGQLAFISPARRALELSHREALQLGRDQVRTEHILLGLISEGEGVAARVLVKLGADYARVRQRLIQLMSGISEANDSSHPWTSVLRELKNAFPRVGIVAMISDELTPSLAAMALEAGATTYVSTIDPMENVAFAVRLANLTRPPG